MRAQNESELPIPRTLSFCIWWMCSSYLAIAVEILCSPAQSPPPVSDCLLWDFPFSQPQKHHFVLPWHPGYTTLLTSALSSRRDAPLGSAQAQPHWHLGHGTITCLDVWGTLDSFPLGKQCVKVSFPPLAWHRKHTCLGHSLLSLLCSVWALSCLPTQTLLQDQYGCGCCLTVTDNWACFGMVAIVLSTERLRFYKLYFSLGRNFCLHPKETLLKRSLWSFYPQTVSIKGHDPCQGPRKLWESEHPQEADMLPICVGHTHTWNLFKFDHPSNHTAHFKSSVWKTGFKRKKNLSVHF